MSMSNRFRLITIWCVAVIALLSPLAIPDGVNAFYRDGRPIGCSAISSNTYFDNVCEFGRAINDPNGDVGYVLPRRNIGGVWREAMYGVNTKADLKAYLRSNYYSGNPRLQAPAAFIYHTLLGRSGNQAVAALGRNISAADITEVESRLDDPAVTVNPSLIVDAQHNTGGTFNTNGRYDVKFLDNGSGHMRTAFALYHNGSLSYVLQRECANPVGDLPGLPPTPPVWSVNGAMYVNTGGGWTTTSQSVVPGQTIQFLGQISSATATTSDIWHVAYATNAAGGGAVALGSGNNGRVAAGETKSVYSGSFTVPAAATNGTQYCRRLGWSPVNSTGGVNGLSNIVCVTVVVSWNVNGAMYVNTGGGWTTTSQSVVPGQTIQFAGQIASAKATNSDIWHVAYATDAAGGGAVALGSGNNGRLAAGEVKSVYSQSFTVPAAATNGTQYCRRLGWSPVNSSGGVNGLSNIVCVTAVISYQLTPIVTAPTQTVIGSTAAFGYTVGRSGTNTNSTAIATYEVIIPANTVLPAGYGDPRDNGSCANYTSLLGVTCKSVDDSVSTPRTFTLNSTSLGSVNVAVGVRPAGTRVCRLLSIDSRDETPSPRNRFSNLGCTVIAKIPQVQIWGGDVRVGNSFTGLAGTTSSKASITTALASSISGQLYGSWGEYGMLSPTLGTVNSTSGGALSGSTGGISTLSDTQKNVLTFANTSSPYGHWGTPGKFPSIVTSAVFAGGANVSATSINIGTRSGIINLTHAGTVRVSGTLNAGTKTLVLKSAGDVEIDGDLLYGNTSFSSAADVQQLIIIARNIRINPNVSVVNAWLIAQPSGGTGGVISTCGSPGAPNYFTGLRVGDNCETNQLRINGIIMATELQLRRTHGADAVNVLAKPSEIINMRPDAYLWAQAQSSATGQINTIFTTELPPRF